MDLIPLDKEIQKKVYDDLFWPSLKEAGKALWNIAWLITTISLPIQLLNHYANSVFRKNTEKFDEKLKQLPEENIISVEPDIWVPILEKLTYTKNEKIADLFLELLKKAANKNEISLVHPKYIKIIESLSEDEALLIEYLYKSKTARVPYIDLRFVNLNNSTFNERYRFFTALNDKISFNFPQNLNTYLLNLESIGIFDRWNDWRYIPDEWENKPYDSLINHPEMKKQESLLNPDIQRVKHTKGVFEITPLWLNFLNAVYLNNNSIK